MEQENLGCKIILFLSKSAVEEVVGVSVHEITMCTSILDHRDKFVDSSHSLADRTHPKYPTVVSYDAHIVYSAPNDTDSEY